MSRAEETERYLAAAHAMQTAVALDQARGSQDGTPKHLRVGLNSAMVQVKALAELLIAKGVFTLDEYITAQADAMETEADDYAERLGLDPRVTLR